MVDEIQHKNIIISSDRAKLDLEYIYHFLTHETYWAKTLPYDRFITGVNNSLCYGVYTNSKQIGFARVVTDFSETASIWDVFIDTQFRGLGYGKLLIKTILENPQTQDVFKWFLMTEDAHELYEKFSFSSSPHKHVMHKITPPTF